MTTIIDELRQQWQDRLSQTEDSLTDRQRDTIINWLLGEDSQRWENLDERDLEIAKRGLVYLWQILRQRYLKVSPTRGYRNLIDRLGACVTLRQKIRTWVSLSRDRRQAVADVLQEIIQEMLNSDRYLQSQLAWIARCTTDQATRDQLLLATLEEYALRPIRNQPLLAYRFVNYLRRQSRSGITNVPRQEMIRILSDEISGDEGENSLSLLDQNAIATYEDERTCQEAQILRVKVQESFAKYLEENVSPEAVTWFNLYLGGESQDAIALAMNIPVQRIYRLREKVGYHAIKVFALKEGTELISEWLQI
ncbi:MAG: HetZ-related protein 2, partial [Microcystis sp. M49629_WE12]|nr:HetZ-related protein 2 [Microcystis sp. M49629_WE12]